MKQGANKGEQAKIKKLAGQGHTVNEITNAMGINKKVVAFFMDFDPVERAKEEDQRLRDQQVEADEKRLAAEAAATAALKAVKTDKKKK